MLIKSNKLFPVFIFIGIFVGLTLIGYGAHNTIKKPNRVGSAYITQNISTPDGQKIDCAHRPSIWINSKEILHDNAGTVCFSSYITVFEKLHTVHHNGKKARPIRANEKIKIKIYTKDGTAISAEIIPIGYQR